MRVRPPEAPVLNEGWKCDVPNGSQGAGYTLRVYVQVERVVSVFDLAHGDPALIRHVHLA